MSAAVPKHRFTAMQWFVGYRRQGAQVYLGVRAAAPHRNPVVCIWFPQTRLGSNFMPTGELIRLISIDASEGDIPMDERRTLSILGWTIGVVVGVTFIINAIALTASP
jgi:hypothetical protein